MDNFLEILFLLILFFLAYTYILFPVCLIIIDNIKIRNKEVEDFYPGISVIIPAHNEEKVIEEKIKSIFQSEYPTEKIEILVGSDNSTDKTNEILKSLKDKYPDNIKTYFFSKRQGKVKILNQLVKEASSSILIITDANVIFDINTLKELIKNFKDEKIGLVDSRIIHYNVISKGISAQEHAYISLEFLLKKAEGNLLGATMGPFGGCYAIRKELYTPVPENFLVDDFFISMNVLLKGYKAITEKSAIVFEDVSTDIFLEYKRKKRIATGCFQNLFYFKKLLFNPFNKVSFVFLSHKVIRWKSPFFILFLVIISFLLFNNSIVYKLVVYGFSLVVTLCVFDLFMYRKDVNIKYLRFITHFIITNVAILNGFIGFIKGVKSSIWNPTPRLQHKNN